MKLFVVGLCLVPVMALATQKEFAKVSLAECSYQQSANSPYRYELQKAYARNITQYDTQYGAKLDDWSTGSFGICNLLNVNPNPAGFEILVSSTYFSGSGTSHPWSCVGHHNNYDVKTNRWMKIGDRFFVRMVSPDTVQQAPSKAYTAYAFQFIGVNLPDLTDVEAEQYCKSLTPVY